MEYYGTMSGKLSPCEQILRDIYGLDWFVLSPHHRATMNIVRDPEGPRLARIEYDRDGYPTGRLFLTTYTLEDVRQTSVGILFRRGDQLYVRVREVPPGEESRSRPSSVSPF